MLFFSRHLNPILFFISILIFCPQVFLSLPPPPPTPYFFHSRSSLSLPTDAPHFPATPPSIPPLHFLLLSPPPPPHLISPHPTPSSLPFDLVPALLCWSSNHNPGPWQMEDRREKLLTSQPEPLLSAHQLLPASPPCLQNGFGSILPPPPTHPPTQPPPLLRLLQGQRILLGEWCAH